MDSSLSPKINKMLSGKLKSRKGIIKPKEPGHWTLMSDSNTGLLERSGHQVVVLNKKAFVFGGFIGIGHPGQCSNDFFVYDFENKSFTVIECNILPPPRASFQLVAGVSSQVLILCGGYNETGPCNDVWEYSIKTNRWRMLSNLDQLSAKKILIGQSMCAHGSGFVLFGGRSGDEKYSNEVHSLDPHLQTVETFNTSGDIPNPRHNHQSIVVGNKMFVIGGGRLLPSCGVVEIFCLDLETCIWTKLQPLGKAPKARAGHTCLLDGVSNRIFMFGGYKRCGKKVNRVYSYNYETNEWRKVADKSSQSPVGRAFQAGLLFDSSIYVFGGNDGKKRFSDVWKFDIRVQPCSLLLAAATVLIQSDPYLCQDSLPAELLLIRLQSLVNRSRPLEGKKYDEHRVRSFRLLPFLSVELTVNKQQSH